MNGTSIVRVSAAAVVAMLISAPLVAQPGEPQQQTGPVSGLNAAPSQATTIELALEEAVRRALENNPDLALVRLGTEVEAARVVESQGAFTPVLATTVGRSSIATPPSNFLLGESGVDANDWFSSTGVRQRLPWGGGVWSVSWDASRTTTSNPLTAFSPILQSGLQLAFSQPLFKDREVDAARHQYVVTKRNHESSELRFRESVVQTVAAVKQAYWTLKALAANVIVQRRSLELAEELVRQNKARVDHGQAPPLDLVQAEAEVAQRRENLIRASSTAGDAEDQLRRLIMDPADASFWRVRLDPVDEPAGSFAVPDVEEAVRSALEGRYDVARARNEMRNAEADVAFFNNQKLPDIRLEASYRGNGLGGTQFLRSGGFPGVVTGTLDKGFGTVLNQVFSNDYATWSLGFTVSYPLGRSYEEASLARADVERRQAAQRILSLQARAAEEIRRAARQVQSTSERIDAARAGARLAEERYQTEQRRYEAGLSTSFLVTQAQRDLVQAQVNLLQATLDHQSSLVNFEALQMAPPLREGEGVGLRGSEIVRVPASSPQGVFRQAAGASLQ
ncbi:MAG: TolC family protein [Acidobacteria bacterium]|nr:MAG: TolC family protein [Acidobacteriota bacterium]